MSTDSDYNSKWMERSHNYHHHDRYKWTDLYVAMYFEVTGHYRLEFYNDLVQLVRCAVRVEFWDNVV